MCSMVPALRNNVRGSIRISFHSCNTLQKHVTAHASQMLVRTAQDGQQAFTSAHQGMR
jgi:hypothetical protein